MWHKNFRVVGHVVGGHLLLLVGLCWSAAHAANDLPSRPGGPQASSAKPADPPAALPTPGVFRDPRKAPLDPVTDSGSANQPAPSLDPKRAQTPPVATTPQPTAEPPGAARRPPVFPRYPNPAARDALMYEARPPRAQHGRAGPYPGYSRWRRTPWAAANPRWAGYPPEDRRRPGGFTRPYAAPAYPRNPPARSPQSSKQSAPAATLTEPSNNHRQDAAAAQPVTPQPAELRPKAASTNSSKNAIGPRQKDTGPADVARFRPPEL